MKIYPLSLLSQRLDKAIGYPAGIRGLKTLLYGWRMKSNLIQINSLAMRKHANGEAYLTDIEVQNFSEYCGYDLTED